MPKNKFDDHQLHEVTLKILDKYDFPNFSNITDLADKFEEKYFEVYNHLKNKQSENKGKPPSKSDFGL